MVGPLLGLAQVHGGILGFISTLTYTMLKDIKMFEDNRLPATLGRVLKPNSRLWRLFIDQLLTGGRFDPEIVKDYGFDRIPMSIRVAPALMSLQGLIEKHGRVYKLTKKG